MTVTPVEAEFSKAAYCPEHAVAKWEKPGANRGRQGNPSHRARVSNLILSNRRTCAHGSLIRAGTGLRCHGEPGRGLAAASRIKSHTRVCRHDDCQFSRFSLDARRTGRTPALKRNIAIRALYCVAKSQPDRATQDSSRAHRFGLSRVGFEHRDTRAAWPLGIHPRHSQRSVCCRGPTMLRR